jgi:hypothetical protein
MTQSGPGCEAIICLLTHCMTTEVNVPDWVSGRYRAGFRPQLWKM